jgi:mannosyl-3-phosphoglycerate phosphatase
LTTKEHYLVFTDLDGTLLDSDTYEWAEASPALDMLRRREIPVILCSSKTRAEMLPLAAALKLDYPLIVENGAAVLMKSDSPEATLGWGSERNGWRELVLGSPYEELVYGLTLLREELNLSLRGFSEMDASEIAQKTGLSLKAAELARRREYSEPFIFQNEKEDLEPLILRAQEKGLRIVRGLRFYYLMGQTDKARAVRVLRDLYAFLWKGGPIISIGLGDSPNDLLMLLNVDLPVLIRQKSGRYFHPDCDIPGIYRTQEPGPRGWSEALNLILKGADHE